MPFDGNPIYDLSAQQQQERLLQQEARVPVTIHVHSSIAAAMVAAQDVDLRTLQSYTPDFGALLLPVIFGILETCASNRREVANRRRMDEIAAQQRLFGKQTAAQHRAEAEEHELAPLRERLKKLGVALPAKSPLSEADKYAVQIE